MSTTTSLSRTLADVYTSTPFSALPPTVIDDARRSVLDWLGSAMAGALEPQARMARQVVASLGSSDEATVLGGDRSSAAGAALANGVASHILELDDVHKASTLHGGAPIISAALAVAEREHSSGAEFLRAVTLGYDAALRIGQAVNPSHYKYWHPTGTAATFGAAVAAASLIGASAEEMQNAIGTAGTQAAGLWEFNADGTMSKHLHPGKAAFNGILAADLAKAGFTGAGRILEGDRGFMRAMSTSENVDAITARLGAQWKISENCYKMWACCAHTHSAVDVIVDLRRRRGGIEPGEVASIDIETYGPGYEIVKERNPKTPYAAKFSLAYCSAAGVKYGGASLSAFSPDHFSSDGVVDPELATLLSRTRITVAEDLTAKYPDAWPSRVVITLADGTALRGASDYPVGNPENPVTTAQLEDKLSTLVATGWGQHTANRAICIVADLDSCRDMADAFHNLSPAVRPEAELEHAGQAR